MPYTYIPLFVERSKKITLIDAVIKLNKINTEIRLNEFELRLNELHRINNRTRKIIK